MMMHPDFIYLRLYP